MAGSLSADIGQRPWSIFLNVYARSARTLAEGEDDERAQKLFRSVLPVI
jgi:hypothetical protein